jgi:hypothetical protein
MICYEFQNLSDQEIESAIPEGNVAGSRMDTGLRRFAE